MRTQDMTAEELSAEDARRHIQQIAALIHPLAETTMTVFSGPSMGREFVSLTVYPNGFGTADHHFIHATTFADAFAKARAWATTHGVVLRNTLIRRMAMAVIEITDEHGTCTEALLRARRFTTAQIAETHLAACERASQMAGNAPFMVLLDKAPVV